MENDPYYVAFVKKEDKPPKILKKKKKTLEKVRISSINKDLRTIMIDGSNVARE
jgi:hypothetical protein